MKALVTGGLGFIGSHIVDRLISDGHQVVVIDNECKSSKEFYYNPNAEYAWYDIADYQHIFPLFKGVDYVFHLAAETQIQSTINSPNLCVKTNVTGTCNVLQAAKENNIKRVIFSTTSAVYGEKATASTPIGIKEDMPRDCLNPYALSKAFGEDLCAMYLDYGLETVMLRYFNVYGDRQPSTGSYAPVIGIFKKQVNSKEPMTIIGDGLQTRDYIHVSDVVEANVKAAFADCAGQIFNIGTEKQTSVLDLATMIGKVKLGTPTGWMHLPERKAEIKHSKANISKAKNLLDWTPKVKLEDWINENISTVSNT